MHLARRYLLLSLSVFFGAAFLTIGATGCYLNSGSPSGGIQAWDGGYPILTPFSSNRRWLVLKCAFSDDRSALTLPTNLDPAIPDLDTYIDLFLGTAGLGTGNLRDYIREVTYGFIDLQTDIYGWYDAPFPSNSTLSRVERIQQCANAVPDSDGIDFLSYAGIIMVTNKPQDGGAGLVGRGTLTIKGKDYDLGAVVFDSGSLFTAFAAHEMGHGFGLPHSYDNTNRICAVGAAPGEYCDPFDIMSGMVTQQFLNPNYPGEGAEAGRGSVGAGPGMNLPNLLHLYAVPEMRIAKHLVGSSSERITLTALSNANGPLPLGVQIYNPSLPNEIYTLEYRQATGWDKGFAVNAVLIHEYRVKSVPYSILQEGPSNGGWVTGDRYVNADLGFSVLVERVDTAAGTATVRLGN